ncbi:MAG: HD domain-containing protein [Clostridia bacterium]|nr:HD domain-containing protein [Clostridia bacterium]
MITYKDIKNNSAVTTYIRHADQSLEKLGYTEHSFAHVTKTAETAGHILEVLGYDEHTVELSKIAGYIHDIGNLVNRVDHSQSGAIMAFRLLDRMEMPEEDIATIITAIGNHDEGTGVAVNPVAAALIIADKSDVRTSRVRNSDMATFDIHDRVNFSVKDSELVFSKDNKTLTLVLEIDTDISPVMDYFEIFIGRMIMCRKAAETLGLSFKLIINSLQFM